MATNQQIQLKTLIVEVLTSINPTLILISLIFRVSILKMGLLTAIYWNYSKEALKKSIQVNGVKTTNKMLKTSKVNGLVTVM